MTAPPVFLLDIDLLIVLAWPSHIHHALAHHWFDRHGHAAWATCPLAQLAFVRISTNRKILPDAVSPREAMAVLQRIAAQPGHRFWADDIAPVDAPGFRSVALVGHHQVTDADLLALAEHHRGRLATFDRGIADLLTGPRRDGLIERLG